MNGVIGFAFKSKRESGMVLCVWSHGVSVYIMLLTQCIDACLWKSPIHESVVEIHRKYINIKTIQDSLKCDHFDMTAEHLTRNEYGVHSEMGCPSDPIF